MTEPKVIAKKNIGRLLDALREQHHVLSPVQGEGVSYFGELGPGAEALLDLQNTGRSVKEVVLPRTETLFVFEDDRIDKAPEIEDVDTRKGRVVFGVRPCDAASLPMLDAVFLEDGNEDPYYAARHGSTSLIGLGCNNPSSTCFCTSVGGGPFSEAGLDLLMSDLGDRYLLQVTSEEGASLLERIASSSAPVEEATEDDVQSKEELARASEEKIGARIETEDLQAKLSQMYDDEAFWEETQRKCLGCGTCTFLCPTCHCFDVVDETNGRRGRRARVWDSCQYALFTHHASGHNPRPSGKERMRQRVMHKFRYFVDNCGITACTGCGRCVRSCPVNMDIRQVLSEIAAR